MSSGAGRSAPAAVDLDASRPGYAGCRRRCRSAPRQPRSRPPIRTVVAAHACVEDVSAGQLGGQRRQAGSRSGRCRSRQFRQGDRPAGRAGRRPPYRRGRPRPGGAAGVARASGRPAGRRVGSKPTRTTKVACSGRTRVVTTPGPARADRLGDGLAARPADVGRRSSPPRRCRRCADRSGHVGWRRARRRRRPARRRSARRAGWPLTSTWAQARRRSSWAGVVGPPGAGRQRGRLAGQAAPVGRRQARRDEVLGGDEHAGRAQRVEQGVTCSPGMPRSPGVGADGPLGAGAVEQSPAAGPRPGREIDHDGPAGVGAELEGGAVTPERAAGRAAGWVGPCRATRCHRHVPVAGRCPQAADRYAIELSTTEPAVVHSGYHATCSAYRYAATGP